MLSTARTVDAAVRDRLAYGESWVNVDSVVRNLEERLAALGEPPVVPDLASMNDADDDC